MKRLSIALAATFAILVGFVSHADAAVRGQLMVYPATDGDADASFARASNGRRVLTITDYGKTAQAGMVIVRLKNPKLGLTESNILPLPAGLLKIRVRNLSAGCELKLITQSLTGQLSSQIIAVSNTNSLTTAANSNQAFASAKAPVVHPVAIAANRAAFVSLVRSNSFGLNTPLIAELEAQYEEFWAQDVAALTGYQPNAAATTLFDKVVESAP